MPAAPSPPAGGHWTTDGSPPAIAARCESCRIARSLPVFEIVREIWEPGPRHRKHQQYREPAGRNNNHSGAREKRLFIRAGIVADEYCRTASRPARPRCSASSFSSRRSMLSSIRIAARRTGTLPRGFPDKCRFPETSGFAQHRAAELRVVFVAVRRVDIASCDCCEWLCPRPSRRCRQTSSRPVGCLPPRCSATASRCWRC